MIGVIQEEIEDEENVSRCLLSCICLCIIIFLFVINLQTSLNDVFTIIVIFCSFIIVLYCLCICSIQILDYCFTLRRFNNFEREQEIELPPVNIQTVVVIQNPNHISLGYEYKADPPPSPYKIQVM